MPGAAKARAVELPMPTGLPQPVISATRAELGIELSLKTTARQPRRSGVFTFAKPMLTWNRRGRRSSTRRQS